ncbi:MAG: hypothetical protein ACO3C5_05485 [Ilumatobacteraceae bacterium]
MAAVIMTRMAASLRVSRWSSACVVVVAAIAVVAAPAAARRPQKEVTNPVTFVDDTSYSWSTPKWVVTRELMGVTTIDQMKPAGVNSGGFIDKAGNLRIIYTTMGNLLGKASAISKDGGATWSVDTAFVFPSGLKDGVGHFAVTTAPGGGYRAFARDDVGIVSITSTDGQTWVADPGYRVTVAALGIAATDGAGVVQQPDGKYRMYLGDESSYFRTCGSTRPVSTVIHSATSTDQITWTVDPDYRIGPELTELCKLHPHAFRDSNGDVVAVFHINNYVEKGRSEWTSSCFFGRSKDGTSFPSIQRVPIGLASDFGGEVGASDCDVVMMPDKTVRLFFSQSGKVGMAIGTPMLTIKCQKGKLKKTLTGTAPVCPKGWVRLKTITCTKGKIVKTVTAAKPVCPKGYKKST